MTYEELQRQRREEIRDAADALQLLQNGANEIVKAVNKARVFQISRDENVELRVAAANLADVMQCVKSILE